MSRTLESVALAIANLYSGKNARTEAQTGMVGFHMSGAAARTETPEPQEVHATRGRTWMMIIGTVLAFGALLSQVPSLAQLWETVKDATWWWIVLAIACTFGNRVGYALALMGSVSIQLPFLRSVEALLAAAFSNLAVPGIGGTAVQVRYLQLQGVDLASAVAAGAVLANVANVAVQGALFLVAVALTSYTFDLDRIDLENVVAILMLIIFLAGVLLAVVFGVRRFRETRPHHDAASDGHDPDRAAFAASAPPPRRRQPVRRARCRHSVCSRASRHTADPWVTGRSSW